MIDRSKQQLIPPSTNMRLPSVPEPRPSLPSLPSRSNAFAFTEKTALRNDTALITQHAAKLRAMADQAAAFRELVEKRDALALAISNLHSLGERCAHQYEMGRLSRHNERQLALLNYEHDQLQAKVRNAAAQLQLAQYQPQLPEAPTAPPPPAPAGLAPSDVRQIAQMMPDMKPETIEALVLALGGLMAEKSK